MTTEIKTFSQYEVLATIVKYGNLYKTKDPNSNDLWQPLGDDVQVNFFGDEKVQWLVAEGLAKHTEYNPHLALGRVEPTPAAKEVLEAVVLTREMEGVGTHLSHCCTKHGCKYGDEFCPVEQGLLEPDYEKCGLCYEYDDSDREAAKEIAEHILIEELKSRGYTITQNVS